MAPLPFPGLCFQTEGRRRKGGKTNGGAKKERRVESSAVWDIFKNPSPTTEPAERERENGEIKGGLKEKRRGRQNV